MKENAEINPLSIEELKNDFPEYQEVIDLLAEKVELFGMLAQDYYLCKRKLNYLKSSNKPKVMAQFNSTLEELRTEIDQFLKENTI